MKRLLTTDFVCDRTGRKKSWVYKQVKLGNFPRPIQPRLWLESDVEACIDRLIAQHSTRLHIGTRQRPQRGTRTLIGRLCCLSVSASAATA